MLGSVITFVLLKIVAHNANALLVVDESAFWLNLLEQASNLKVGVIVLRVELANMPEQLQCLVLVLWGTRLTSLYLSQESYSFVTVFVPGAGKDVV